jgi:hypothetical protein
MILSKQVTQNEAIKEMASFDNRVKKRSKFKLRDVAF